MTVDPRHLYPPDGFDPAATQPEAVHPTAEYPVPPHPGAAHAGAAGGGQAAAAYRAAPQPQPQPQPATAYPPAAYGAHPHDRMLAASADRERAVDVLKAGFAEGRLTQAEYNDRVGRVYASRTYGELEFLVGDLPAGPLGGRSHYPPVAYPVHQEAPRTNSLAVASLVCGLGEFFTMGLTAIPAIICGHAARRQMRQTGERGDGMAVAGLLLGWAGIGLFIAMVVAMIAVASTAAHGVGPAVPAVPGPPG